MVRAICPAPIMPSLHDEGPIRRNQGFSCVQNIMEPVCLINIGVFLMSPLIFSLFIRHLGWGLFGAAMANNVACAATSLCMFASAIWIHYKSRERHPKRLAWPGLSSQALKVCSCLFSVFLCSLGTAIMWKRSSILCLR
jgi:Na+-driven multidrug efflux pump